MVSYPIESYAENVLWQLQSEDVVIFGVGIGAFICGDDFRTLN